MHPNQPVNARAVFHGSHFVDWRSNQEIIVLGSDHQTRVWAETSSGTYRLKEGPTQ